MCRYTVLDPGDEDEHSKPVGAIAGGATGGAIILILAIIGTTLCCRRRRKARYSENRVDLMDPPVYPAFLGEIEGYTDQQLLSTSGIPQSPGYMGHPDVSQAMPTPFISYPTHDSASLQSMPAVGPVRSRIMPSSIMDRSSMVSVSSVYSTPIMAPSALYSRDFRPPPAAHKTSSSISKVPEAEEPLPPPMYQD